MALNLDDDGLNLAHDGLNLAYDVLNLVNDDMHRVLKDKFLAFLETELTRCFRKGKEMENAMRLHHSRMKEVCESIKAHDHWVRFSEHFPEFARYCYQCGDAISPEFDRWRHMGRCNWYQRNVFYPE